MVLAILNSNGLEPITWQQINLRIDSGGLGIGIDARTSYAAFAASFLSAVKAASEIYPILHSDIVDVAVKPSKRRSYDIRSSSS